MAQAELLDISQGLQQRMELAQSEFDKTAVDIDRLVERKHVLQRYLEYLRSLFELELSNPLQPALPLEEFRDMGGKAENGKPPSLRFAGKSHTQAAYDLLMENGRPMHVSDIFKGLIDGGIQTDAKRPLEVITSRLIRDKRFKNIGKRTFKLTIWDEAERR